MVNFCKYAKAIKKHFDDGGRDLTSSLKAAGANADEAKQIDKFIQNRIKDKTGKTKAELIKKALGKDLTKAEQKAAFDRLVEESNKGGLNEYSVKRAIGESLGITQLTKEQRENIQGIAKKLQKAKVGSNERKVLANELSHAINDVKPRTADEYAKTLIFTADLLNPVTQIKNVFGNAIYSGWRAINAQAAGALDWAYVGANNLLGGKATRERFVTIADAKLYKRAVDDFWSGLKEGTEEAWKGINTTNLVDDKYNLTGRQVFKGKFNPLTWMEKATRVALSAPDRAFYKMAAGQEVEQLIKAAKAADPKFRGIPTPEMLELAHLEGLKATFQDDSLAAKAAQTGKKFLNFNQKFGLGDLALTYTKTPANILTRAVEMTPLKAIGIGADLLKHFKGEELIKRGKLIEGVTNATLGTGLIAWAAMFSKMGLITATLPAGKEGANKRTKGEQAFSINIDGLKRFVLTGRKETAKARTGDKMVNYGWAQPIAIPLAIGATLGKNADKELDEDASAKLISLLDSATEAGEVLLDNSFLKGVQTLFDGQPNDRFAGVKKVVLDSLGRPIPARSLLGQISRSIDNTQRETYDKNPIKQSLNKIQAGIPFASKQLPAKVDVAGKEIKTGSDNVAIRALNTFLSPTKVTELKRDPEINEVLRLYDETGEKGQLLKQADKKVKLTDINGNKIVKQLSGRELSKYQTFLGRESKAIIGEAMQNADFGEMDDEDKANVLQRVIKATNEAAKVKLFRHNPKKVSPLAQAILDEDQDLAAEQLQNLIDKQANKQDKSDDEYIGYLNE